MKARCPAYRETCPAYCPHRGVHEKTYHCFDDMRCSVIRKKIACIMVADDEEEEMEYMNRLGVNG